MTIGATLSLATAEAKAWDVIVVGAGPAGAVAAHELARNGIRVLLVDKQPFPRDKVCGACLSSQALQILERLGMGRLPGQLGGAPYDQLRLWSQQVTATVPLPEGIALTRFTLDHALVQQAIAAGAQFLPSTQAALGDLMSGHRLVRLKQHDQYRCADAKLVVAADGIGGNLLCQAPEITYRTWKHSRIGVGASLASGDETFCRGSITMAVGRRGYVGLVRAENDVLNIGAALDIEYLRKCGEISTAIETTLKESGLPGVAADSATWRGTPPLTRVASRVGGDRLFAIGDAAAYAEPFTGEGQAWAMMSAVMVVPHLLRALESWQGSIALEWDRAYRQAMRRRQSDCRHLARLLRRPWLVRNSISVLKHYPRLARPLVRRINSIPKKMFT